MTQAEVYEFLLKQTHWLTIDEIMSGMNLQGVVRKEGTRRLLVQLVRYGFVLKDVSSPMRFRARKKEKDKYEI